MESVFNLICFVTRAEADLKVSSAAEGGKKRVLYPYTQVSSVSFLYVNLNLQHMDANGKKVLDFHFASWPPQSLGFNTILMISAWRIIIDGKFSFIEISAAPERMGQLPGTGIVMWI